MHDLTNLEEDVDEIYDPYNPDHIFRNIEIMASNMQYYAQLFINFIINSTRNLE